MLLQRREFLMRTSTLGVGALAASLIPEEAEAQAAMAFLRACADKLGTALLNFASKVAVEGTARVLNSWLETAGYVKSPPPPTWHHNFSPAVQVNIKNVYQPFKARLAAPDRKLVVAHLPKIAPVYDDYNDLDTHLNVRELNEFSNLRNGLIYNIRDGLRVPMTPMDRRPFNNLDLNKFQQIVDSRQLPIGYGQDAYLDYIREFCRCDGVPLIGFGYHVKRPWEPSPADHGTEGNFTLHLNMT